MWPQDKKAKIHIMWERGGTNIIEAYPIFSYIINLMPAGPILRRRQMQDKQV